MDYENLRPRENPDEYSEAHPFPDPGPDADVRLIRKHSFVSGNRKGNGLRVRFFHHPATQSFLARAWFGPETEGPPGLAHGGSQAALLDEVMGALPWFLGHPVLAAKIEIQFRRSIPLGTVVTVRAELKAHERKKMTVVGSIVGDDDTLFTEGSGLFIEFDLPKLFEGAKK